MKTYIALLLAFQLTCTLARSQNDDYPAPAPGKLWGGFVASINTERTRLATILSTVPAGENGQSSPWFGKLQAIKAQLDQAASSQNQTDLFGVIPQVAEILQEQNPPPFVDDASGPLQNLSVAWIESAATHVAEQNGSVAPTTLASLTTLFAVRGFITEANWEEGPMPIDAAGVLILDATAVVNQLKAGPWQQARRFLNSATNAATYFARYLSSGNGLAVVKSKYAQNQAAIDAKFVELKNWIAQQEAAAGSP